MRIEKKSLIQCEWCGAYVEHHTICYIESFNGEYVACEDCRKKFIDIYNDNESEDDVF